MPFFRCLYVILRCLTESADRALGSGGWAGWQVGYQCRSPRIRGGTQAHFGHSGRAGGRAVSQRRVGSAGVQAGGPEARSWGPGPEARVSIKPGEQSTEADWEKNQICARDEMAQTAVLNPDLRLFHWAGAIVCSVLIINTKHPLGQVCRGDQEAYARARENKGWKGAGQPVQAARGSYVGPTLSSYCRTQRSERGNLLKVLRELQCESLQQTQQYVDSTSEAKPDWRGVDFVLRC